MHGVLIDTSAWIDAFRGSDLEIKKKVDVLLDEDRATLCGVVEMELFQGVRAPERKKVFSLLRILKYIETEREDWIVAGQEYAHLRARGVTLPSTDVLVAAMCLRRQMPLLATDAHFEHFCKRIKMHG